MNKKVFLTGIAGFIGYSVAKRLLKDGYDVVAIDNINDYYDVRVKYGRLEDLGIDGHKATDRSDRLTFYKIDLVDYESIEALFAAEKFDYVINLAAQAGVRHQFENPQAYVDSNLQGFVNMMEVVRHYPVEHFLYASSSSVYGLNEQEVFQEDQAIDHPASLYAATKRANELIAHSYSNLFNVPTTGLRFFTVYGPWGRPDMFMYKLAESIVKGTEITIFQRDGKSLWRDYTFIDDIVEGIMRVMVHPAEKKDISLPNQSSVPFAIYNIGRGEPIENAVVIAEIEKFFGKPANKKMEEGPSTEIFQTYASTKLLEAAVGYKPKVSVKEGMLKFCQWYKKFHNV